MLKIWLAIGLAMTVAVIIIFMGIMNQARFTVILYRTIISISIFASCGYILGMIYETKFLPYAKSLLETDVNNQEHQRDEDTKQATGKDDNSMDDYSDDLAEKKEETDFAPFTTDNFKRVVSPPNS
ncbi:MAG: hypothetical protein H6Q70_6 [Firmicutes bacterium]|nr:hypothetical protein [Bacillota bacterium]